ncbi:hypothetical protein OIO90_002953 [Microbotryomycetes sp. JL221]|nr:hypothetical protein OIO90_002953 [Microbotryomycetes sp. JL221]
MPYAEPPTGARRFQDPSPISTLVDYDATGLPPACPQPLPVAASEDCLFLTVYTPVNVSPKSKLPVMLWLVGGSYYYGSTTAYGIDGSDLVKNENIIVVTVQHRLGALGFARHDNFGLTGNYGVKDVVAALEFVQSDISSFGGDPARVTVAGHSSGAELVKTLLVTPSASSLFARAILQSAPLDFVDQTPETANSISEVFTSQLQCINRDCLVNAPIQAIIGAQMATLGIGASGGFSGISMLDSFFRPVVDSSFISNDFRAQVEQDVSSIANSKSFLISTMRDEAAQHIAYYFQQPLDSFMFAPLVSQFFPGRAQQIIESGLYDPSNFHGSDAVRDAFTRIATDFMWTCPNQRLAVKLARAGGTVYQAQFDLGISYSNKTIAYTANKPVHENDLLALFHPTDAGLTPKQRTLVKEVQKRWAHFIKDGTPNAPRLARWTKVGVEQTNLNLLVLGAAADGKGQIQQSQRIDACEMENGAYVTL